MILSDTGVIIDFWRKPKPNQTLVFNRVAVAFCGITRAELYAGARSELEIERYSIELAKLFELQLEFLIWERLGKNLRTLRSKGIIVPFPDAVIATVALELDIEIWTYDRHFALMQSALPKLRLFDEKSIVP